MRKNGEYVGVDEKFIPEDEKYVNEYKEERNIKINKTAKSFATVYIILTIALFAMVIGVVLFTISSINKDRKNMRDAFDKKATTIRYDYDEGIRLIEDNFNKN